MLPRVEPVEPVRGAGAKGSAADEGMQFSPSQQIERSTAGFEIDGLRPYREGAPASRIHWPAVARSGEMLERRLVAGLDAAPLVVLDATRPPKARKPRRRRARRGLAGRPSRPRRRLRDPAARRAQGGGGGLRSRRLAGGARPARAGRARARSARGDSRGPGGAVIWVSAQAERPARRGLERLSAGSRWLVCPFTPGMKAAFTVAGLHRRPARSRAAPAGGGGVSGAVARLAPAAPVAAEERDSTLVRLVAFTGLAAFGAGHWWGMAAGAQRARRRGGGGGRQRRGLLSLLPRLALPRTAEGVLAVAVTLLMLCAGLAAAGLSLKLLLPGNWSELSDGLDRELSGIRTIDWPYDGPDAWVRLTILLGAPLLLTAASALAFWPVRRYQSFWRAEALIALLLLYGVAVTNHDPGSPRPRLHVTAAGGRLALAAAPGPARRARRAWRRSPRASSRYRWPHRSTAISPGGTTAPSSGSEAARAWSTTGTTATGRSSPGPRDGTTLMNVKSSQPLYWKTEVLDQFDGVRWLRARQGSPKALAGLPDRFRRSGRSWDYFEYNPRWDRHVRVAVRSLRSDLVIGPGTIYQVSGAGATVSADDSTTFKLDEPLEGDSYTVSAYAPKPSARQMRRGATSFPAEVSRYTEIELPGQGDGGDSPPRRLLQRHPEGGARAGALGVRRGLPPLSPGG